jgi:hypothetical protein
VKPPVWLIPDHKPAIHWVVSATPKLTTASHATLRAAKKPPETVVHDPANHRRPLRLIWGAKISIVIIAWAILLVYVAHAAISASLPVVGK